MNDRVEVLKILAEILRKELNNAKLVVAEASSANNVDGWDSINNLSIISEIETRFNITFSIDVIFKLETVGDICDHIISNQK